MTLVTSMSVAAAARVHNTRLWRIVQHYVEKAVAREDGSAGTDQKDRGKRKFRFWRSGHPLTLATRLNRANPTSVQERHER
jgi:hypothetical protein